MKAARHASNPPIAYMTEPQEAPANRLSLLTASQTNPNHCKKRHLLLPRSQPRHQMLKISAALVRLSQNRVRLRPAQTMSLSCPPSLQKYLLNPLLQNRLQSARSNLLQSAKLLLQLSEKPNFLLSCPRPPCQRWDRATELRVISIRIVDPSLDFVGQVSDLFCTLIHPPSVSHPSLLQVIRIVTAMLSGQSSVRHVPSHR